MKKRDNSIRSGRPALVKLSGQKQTFPSFRVNRLLLLFGPGTTMLPFTFHRPVLRTSSSVLYIRCKYTNAFPVFKIIIDKHVLYIDTNA